MSEKVELYNTAYGNNETEVYSEIRRETYGLDIGQTGWVGPEELGDIPRLLQIDASSNALEIGCGAGGCALHFAETIGCRVTGVDLNAAGILAAEHACRAQRLAERVRFIQHDAGVRLPFSDETFDATYSNDAFCHIPDRLALLRECRRVMKTGARLLFSDALVVNGALSNEEIATRSSIGYYVFVPGGENERLIRNASLTLVSAEDTTPQAAAISQRWHDARERRKIALRMMEGEVTFDGLQRFLAGVHTLTAESRLARFLYIAAK
jgi:ubiquinone/menaquinone biosynthesis C-methylase UbiE